MNEIRYDNFSSHPQWLPAHLAELPVEWRCRGSGDFPQSLLDTIVVCGAGGKLSIVKPDSSRTTKVHIDTQTLGDYSGVLIAIGWLDDYGYEGDLKTFAFGFKFKDGQLVSVRQLNDDIKAPECSITHRHMKAIRT